MAAIALIFWLSAALWAAPSAIALPGEMRGGAMAPGGRSMLVWGEGLYRVRLDSGRVERLSVGSFRKFGCVAEKGVVLQAGERLVWLAGPRFDRETVIDTGGEIADCLEATLLGRRGILVTWRGLQVRHYFPGGPDTVRWDYREIYSFYTASYQAGLLVRDVDGDGMPDILCGNYWIRSPESYDLPWRLFAINTWNEEPMSARVKLEWLERPGAFPLLAMQQRAMPQGRVATFERPADPKQLWKESRRAVVAPVVWRRMEPAATVQCLEAWVRKDGLVCLELGRIVISAWTP